MELCNEVFAEPMLDDDNFLKKYFSELQKLQEAGVLPSDLEKKMTYQVYSLEGSSCGAHRSIVLSADNEHFFSIELGFIITGDGVKRIYPVTQRIDASFKQKFTHHGEVTMSTSMLLARGVATMKNFGSYFKFCNNCQDYCNYYLDAIGLGYTKMMTDGDKTSLIAAAVIYVALLLKLIFKK